jgi:UDP-N-acetylglucosamine--N-acetylmuramyl-(pentapeptide) pyrophosphoryl-undecaprenol N-acetylglucosamine transferase
VRVVLAGGGTAGHVEPALALADALRRADPAVEITALGTESGVEARLVPARGYELALVPAVPLPRRPTPQLLRVPGALRASVRAALAVLDRTRADVLVGFGGYVSFPGYAAARRRRLPYVVHEANLRPGLANRVAARGTRFVAVASAAVRLPHARPVGIPIREAIATLDRSRLRAEARSSFGLAPDLPTLLVTGGSKGARHVNETVGASAGVLAAAGIQVLHHTGRGNEVTVRRPEPAPPYVTVAYVDRMDLAYAAADLVVCRAGAMTCAELTAVGLPAVYVPLPVGNGEQRLNAEPIAAAGGGLLVADADFTPGWFAATVPALLADAPRLAAMGAAAAGLGHRDADERLADLVREAVTAGP